MLKVVDVILSYILRSEDLLLRNLLQVAVRVATEIHFPRL